MAKFSYKYPVLSSSLSEISDQAVSKVFLSLFSSLDLLKKELARSINALYNGDQPSPLKSYTVATLPSASTYANHMIYVSDESGGAVPAFSDGTNWRRVTDRAIVS